MPALRPYQTAILADIAAALRAGHRRVCVVLPTGGGKTVVFAEAVRRIDRPTVVVAHRKELLRQASAKLDPIRHGIIAPWARPNQFYPVQVASIQTLTRRAAPPADVLVIDECHHAVARDYRRMLDRYPDAIVLGFTATPERLDGRGLGEVFTALVQGPTTAELTADEYLAPVMTYAPARAPDLRDVRTQAGDYMTRELAVVMDKPTITGDAVAHYRKHAAGRPAIVFCVSVAHAESAARAFAADGWRAVAVGGHTPDAQRDRVISGLATGSTQVLTSCALIDEGLDVPAVGCVVDLAPTQSLGRFLQRVGRGRRPDPDGRPLVHLDHAGNTLRHGLPDAPRVWSLDGVPRKERTAPAVAQCPECYAMHTPGPVCPACGYAYHRPEAAAGRVIRTEAGELVLTTSVLAQLRRGRLHDLVKGLKTWDDCERLRIARGLPPAWSYRVARMAKIRPGPAASGDEFSGVAA